MNTTKKELRKINRGSSEIMAAIGELVREDNFHPFSRRALDLDRQVEYADDVNAELHQMHTQKDRKALELVQQVGALATAYAMRRYFDILADKSASDENRRKAIDGAIELLVIVSKIGNEDTTDINRQILKTAAKDASMKDIDDVANAQYMARRPFYSPEVVRDIRQNSRVRD